MKKLLIALLTMFTLAGCSTLESLGDYISENDVLTSIATRQAVARYIAAGDTIEAEQKRAKQVETRLARIVKYVDGNPIATVDGLMNIIESSIDWNELETADKFLVNDILTLLKSEFDKYGKEQKGLSEKSRIAIRSLFDTAMSAARIYLMR